jgi:hypothetical protein
MFRYRGWCFERYRSLAKRVGGLSVKRKRLNLTADEYPGLVTARFLCVRTFDCFGGFACGRHFLRRCAGYRIVVLLRPHNDVRFRSTSGCGGEEVVDAKERGNRGEGSKGRTEVFAGRIEWNGRREVSSEFSVVFS